jgi:tetratricopeptide (TPR) repeat protein
LSHLAGEYKGPGKDMMGAETQAAYDGACLVYRRNQARLYLGNPDPPGHAFVSTFTTDGTTLNTYADQGKLAEAEKMYMRALSGYEEAFGPEAVEKYRPELNAMRNLGELFKAQGEINEAKAMFLRALAGFHALLGPLCDECLELERTLSSLDSSKTNSEE